ncbi:MAG: O-sialoglycoprotein endopeptidase, partial [Anaerovoracaceae bacterium]
MNNQYILGIDTSNYTTSVALISPEGVYRDVRRLLSVKEGERGLRQSTALFQHIGALPELMTEIMTDFTGKLAAVSVSTRPRPVEGSYMPVFKAGQTVAISIAQAMGIPCYEFSHQEGHIEAVRPPKLHRFTALHLSGGTCELLKVNGTQVQCIGGSKDISFGQVIDRVGVAMGTSFPAGKVLDGIAKNATPSKLLKPIAVKDNWFNLSGIESACQRGLSQGANPEALVGELFEKLAGVILALTPKQEPFVLVGGVAGSQTIQGYLQEKKNIIV